MTSPIENQLDQARKFLEQGQSDQAHEILINILQSDPDNKSALLMIGGYYFSANQLPEAEMIFEQLILQEPGTGQYSIALFNTLWKQNRMDEAFEEIRRFMATADKTTEKTTIEQYVEITRQFAQQLKKKP